ncbi:MAG: 4-alpha-glucanotransferase [Deltaproteobacteria bacterium RBG_16_47_11]|nr:MAG: 4-alpha-glucanotransferase [Deltaproteobacteria bacterium RBG_16_47_11]
MKRRASGILLHMTSLPSPFGIGDLGPRAYEFADFLSETGQSFWQVLPLNPTSLRSGNAPYSSPSAFAGNPLLINPEFLTEKGYLSKSETKRIPPFSAGRVDYRVVSDHKGRLFSKAYRSFRDRQTKDCEFETFGQEHNFWLEDYALFAALKDHFEGKVWNKWPADIRDRQAEALRRWKEELAERIEVEKFLQFVFFQQWFSLKRYCNSKGIQIIGDIPFYVSYDSAGVWANPEIFKLNSDKKPLAVAGIPPDYFSSTGQLWSNPIYRWDVLKEMNYLWWVRRIAHNLKLFDIVRLDHFKGFVDYWEVPAGERTAVKGRWVKGPGADFFDVLSRFLPSRPFIAEDLGVITPEVHQLRDRFDFPGMRVLQFAFGNDPLAEEYKPMNYIKNCVAYTGTHDNDTLIGWLYGGKGHSTRRPEEIHKEKRNALAYLGDVKKGRENIHWEFIRLLMMSAANLVISPVQDLLGLGESARMNRPAIFEGNWEWRLKTGQLTPLLRRRLAEMTRIYGRI